MNMITTGKIFGHPICSMIKCMWQLCTSKSHVHAYTQHWTATNTSA